ncbi:MAG: DNA-3-methyladenine glycosylase 2 family protein [Spirochaetota bacterium]
MPQSRQSRLKQAVAFLKAIDSPTKELIQSVGECNYLLIGTPFYVLVKSVIGQQLSIQAADAIQKRCFAYLNEGNVPKPRQILQAGEQDLRSCGLSRAKIACLQNIASCYIVGSLADKELLQADKLFVSQKLLALKGIGPWTVEMVLIFALDHWDIFSMGDLGLRRGIEKWYGIPREDKKSMQKFVKRFSPYQTILSWYLWTYDDKEPWE